MAKTKAKSKAKPPRAKGRIADVDRKTRETRITARVNLDGTNYQYQDFGPVVWSSTGVQTFAYGGYQAKKGMRPFIRRMASNAGQFAYTGASLNSGLIDYYSGDLNAGAGNVTISTNSPQGRKWVNANTFF